VTVTGAGVDAAVAAAVESLRRASCAVEATADAHEGGGGLAAAIRVLLGVPGHVVVSGLGKSGHVAAKVAATLSSTGTPASYVHAGDALHGDSGVLRPGDALVAISNSGETAELCAFAAMAIERGVPVVAVTGCTGASSLSKQAAAHLDASVERECDPEDLVPSASTTVALALGDALAIGLMVARGFGRADFARHHPGGSLGRRLGDP
jgi:arabinose-5-phosphate isomerase